MLSSLSSFIPIVLLVLPPQCEDTVTFTKSDDGCSDSTYGFIAPIALQAPELVCVAMPGYEYMLDHSCICGALQGAGYLAMADRPVVDTSLCWAGVGAGPNVCRQVVACGVAQSEMIFEDGFESGDTGRW